MTFYTIANSGAFIEEFTIKPYQTGCLSNLTFAVKDCIDIKNKRTGFGNPTWLDTHSKAVEHAVCVELLLSHGASCIGKTITDEFTYSLIGENFFYGTPVNPKCPDRVPGGSSSGSASCVACGLADFALGTDTGGSIRVPASNCGIYGFRPSHGKISVAGTIPLAPSFDSVGVMAKDASTLNTAASVLLGTETDKLSKPFHVAVIKDILDACNPAVREITLRYLDQHVKDYSLIELSEITSKEVTTAWLFELYGLLHSCELWSVHGSWVECMKPKLGPIADYNFNHIAKVANRQLLANGIKKREWFAKKLQAYLKNDTLLCFPTTPEFAPKKGVYSQKPAARKKGSYFERLIATNAIAVFSRSPQVTIPMENDIPIGISFLAGYNQDGFLLSYAL